MTTPRAIALAWVLSSVCVSVSGQEGNAGLTKNPFSRPSYMVELQEAPASAVFAEEPVELQLVATLVSDGRSLANIDGEVLVRGDTYQGYRVLTIGEGSVVLVKDGERMTLDLEDGADADETRD